MSSKPIAFVSGASGGIGGAIAKRLAVDGYSLILQYNKNKQKIDALANELKKYDISITTIHADFADPTATMNIISSLTEMPDVIIHNSGRSHWGLMTDLSQEEVISELTVGLSTPLLITKYFLPSLIQKQRGKIIVISSIWGLTGASCEVLYSTIKGGLNSFVKALGKEVAPCNIQVNGVAPGAIDTQMIEHLSGEEREELIADIPAGRLGTPEEVASLVSFLASDQSSYINGQIISPNGAWYC